MRRCTSFDSMENLTGIVAFVRAAEALSFVAAGRDEAQRFGGADERDDAGEIFHRIERRAATHAVR
ncbi:hypothetical protein A8E12_09270 [Burkholderia cenocepacia]|nr:hypothetical protein A8E12_09270 [Burkholderia cenocepacia]